MHMVVNNIVFNDLGVKINTMLVPIWINDTVELKMCQKISAQQFALLGVQLYASAHVYMRMRVKVP